MRRACPRLADLLWPDVDPPTEDEAAAQERKDNERRERNLAALRPPASRAGQAEASLAPLFESLDALIADEKDRRQSVEARLTTVLGFVTVASTLALGAVGLRVHDGLLGSFVLLGVIAVLLLLYIALQVIRAGFAAIAGLERGAVDAPPVDVTVAAAHDPSLWIPLAEHRMKHLESLSELTNRKVNQLAIAHQALRNFLRGALALIGVIVAMLIRDLASGGPSNPASAAPLSQTTAHDVGVLVAAHAPADAGVSSSSNTEDATTDSGALVDAAPTTTP